MLSRVAERIYWTARYLERIENIARLVSVYDNLLYDLPKDTNISWYNLIVINGSVDVFHERYTVKSERNVVKFLLADESNFSSMFSSIKMLRENIRTSRDAVPQETWELVNELYLYTKNNTEKGINRSKRHAFLNVIIESCQMIVGLLTGTMSRDSGWQFVMLGRNLERADMTTRVLDAGAYILLQPGSAGNLTLAQVVWSKVLKSQSAYLNYRRTVRTSIHPSKVVLYLLKDKEFPRTFDYCLAEIKQAIAKLPRYQSLKPVIEDLESTQYTINSSDDLNESFRQYLNDLQIKLMTLNDAIIDTWFAFNEETAA